MIVERQDSSSNLSNGNGSNETYLYLCMFHKSCRTFGNFFDFLTNFYGPIPQENYPGVITIKINIQVNFSCLFMMGSRREGINY